MRPLITAITLVLLAACRSATPVVRLQGDEVSMAWLAGVWDGDYWGRTGRSGTLSFYLPSGTDSLYGDVAMLTPSGRRVLAADPIEQHRQHVQSLQSLSIRVVRVYGNVITGTLEPYVSPDCDCVVTTTFTGRIMGDTIDGGFVTRARDGLVTEGQWRVKRHGTTRP